MDEHPNKYLSSMMMPSTSQADGDVEDIRNLLLGLNIEKPMMQSMNDFMMHPTIEIFKLDVYIHQCFDEAYTLSYMDNNLRVEDFMKFRIPIHEQHKLNQLMRFYCIRKSIVYNYYKRQGWIVRSGLSYRVDLEISKILCIQPVPTLKSYLLMIRDAIKLDSLEINSDLGYYLISIAEKMNKGAVLVHVIWPNEVNFMNMNTDLEKLASLCSVVEIKVLEEQRDVHKLGVSL